MLWIISFGIEAEGNSINDIRTGVICNDKALQSRSANNLVQNK